MKVNLAQLGARKNYVTLQALSQGGVLNQFSTDLYYGDIQSKLVAGSLSILGRERERLAVISRQCNNLEINNLAHFPSFALRNRLKVRKAAKTGKKFEAFLTGGEKFGNLVRKLKFEGADTVYAFSSAAYEIFRAAHRQSIRCVLDMETPPANLENEMVMAGTANYGDWLPAYWSQNVIGLDEYSERQKLEYELADLVICPSTYARSLAMQAGVADERIRVLPFSMAPRFEQRETVSIPTENPSNLNVLFLGNDAIRKGLPDLVGALQILDSNSINAKGGGDWELTKYGEAECKSSISPLGSVPRSRVKELYQWADVFVLPTLSDTMGVVILEAMSAGVPVIATVNSGAPDLVRDGIDGFVVPVNAQEAIATSLERLLTQPGLLRDMSISSLERSSEFAFEAYMKGLLTILKEAAH